MTKTERVIATVDKTEDTMKKPVYTIGDVVERVDSGKPGLVLGIYRGYSGGMRGWRTIVLWTDGQRSDLFSDSVVLLHKAVI